MRKNPELPSGHFDRCCAGQEDLTASRGFCLNVDTAQKRCGELQFDQQKQIRKEMGWEGPGRTM